MLAVTCDQQHSPSDLSNTVLFYICLMNGHIKSWPGTIHLSVLHGNSK